MVDTTTGVVRGWRMEGVLEMTGVDTEDSEVATVVEGVVDRVVHTVEKFWGGGNTSPF